MGLGPRDKATSTFTTTSITFTTFTTMAIFRGKQYLYSGAATRQCMNIYGRFIIKDEQYNISIDTE